MNSLKCKLRLYRAMASQIRASIGAILCALVWSGTSPSLAQDFAGALHPKVNWSGEWTEEKVLNSIARIVSQTCHHSICPEPADDPNARVATGFVSKVGDYGNVIVTALHNVAGANRVTYHFTTHEGSVPQQTHVLALSMDDDVAFLRLSDADTSRISPLRLVSGQEQRDNLTAKDLAIVSYGHGLASIPMDSDYGYLKSKSPTVLRDFFRIAGGNAVVDEIEHAGYPSLDMPAIGLERCIAAG